MRTTLDAQRLLVVDDFLDAAQCRALNRELEFTWWQPSRVVNRNVFGEIVSFRSRRRASWSAQQEYFPVELGALLDGIALRIESAYGLDRTHFEPWQAIRYGPGEHFEVHHDGGLFGDDDAGERQTTVLLYVQTPDAGGATDFTDLGRTVAARAGRLVLWRNLTDDGCLDERMRHQALPVLAGRKTVLTTWERQHRLTTTREGATQ